MQQLELEQLQIRNADETARNAIGPRKKKLKIDSTITGGEVNSVTTNSISDDIESILQKST